MALIVEDGTIVAGAESYCSVAAADDYHDKRANTAWAALGTPEKEAALRKATDYMTQEFRGSWRGYRASVEQELDWPRTGVEIEDSPVNSLIPDDEVPLEVINACAELALRASSAELSPDLERGVLREKVGELEVQYDPASPQATRYRAIRGMLSNLLKSGGGSIMHRLERV